MKHIFKACIVGIVIVSIKRQNRACDLVHYRARGRLHDNILGKSGRKTAVCRQNIVKLCKLLLRGQMSEEKQECAFLKAESSLFNEIIYKLADLVTAVFKLAVNGMVSASKTVLAEAGVAASQVRLVVPHQANQRIIDAVAQRLDVAPEVVYSNIKSYGNTSAASIGICLDEIVRGKKIDRGDYLLLTAFGGGLTWGALLFRF